jgi:XapX domain-containing protein
MKTALGFIVALAIGIVCRLTDVPLPAPLALLGALLVAAMTVGYVVTDRLLVRRTGALRAATEIPAAQRDRKP